MAARWRGSLGDDGPRDAGPHLCQDEHVRGEGPLTPARWKTKSHGALALLERIEQFYMSSRDWEMSLLRDT